MGNLFGHRFEAAGASHLQPGVQLAGDADLAIHHFGGSPDFERLDLVEIAGVIIHRAGCVVLVNTQLTRRQFFDIEEHA